MTDKPHTPTTEHVRGGYSIKPPGHSVLSARERQAAEFDRWLSKHDEEVIEQWIAENDWYEVHIAAAEQRGKAQAWDEGYQDGYNDGLSDGRNLDNMRDPNENPYRADQEGDDE